MDDVTSKIAFAYSKQQGFVVSALGVMATSGAEAVLERGMLVAAGAELIVLVGAAAILGLVATRSNLEKVNHPALRVLAALFIVQVIGTVAAIGFEGGGRAALGGELGGLALIVLGVVSYPFPIRRGSTVLYSPPAVRELANARSLGLGTAGVFAVAALRLLPGGPGLVPVVPLGLDGGLGAVAALAAVGGLSFLLLSPGVRRTRLMEGLLAAAGIVALLGVSGAAGSIDVWAVALGPALVAGLALATVFGFSGRLNQGRTIISHRA
jgi:hypothetical protein